jgi:hypothetical protein
LGDSGGRDSLIVIRPGDIRPNQSTTLLLNPGVRIPSPHCAGDAVVASFCAKCGLRLEPLRLSVRNGLALDQLDVSYADAVAAVDGVITKPGYGIVTDCLVHGTPVIYTDRGLFP